jgi:putative aminopeptidase FrvX
VVVVRGNGTPRRLIACQLDEPGWIVGGVRPDGWLTVRRLPGRVPPLFDQQMEGQRVSLLGERGLVPGVVGVRSVHLTRGRTTGEEPFTSDDAYVDVGARSAEEARALGIRETTPFVVAKRPHPYGDSLLAAPVAGKRAGCAALVAAASALFLLSSDAVVDRVKDAFKDANAELIASNLSAEQEAKLREVFTEE